MKIVFSVSEAAKWHLTNVNVHNVLDAAPDAEIAVVAFAEAVQVFTDPDIQLHPKAKYYVCNNAINVRKVDRDKLSKDIEIVEIGVIKIVELQEAGHRYIRP